MKRLVVILITLVILAAITFAGLEWLARLEDKHPGSVQFSNSIETSKENNFFITEYRPLSDTVRLKQHVGVIHFDHVFAERGWKLDTSTFYLLHKKLPADINNIIINYSQLPQTAEMNFDLAPVNDSINNSGVAHYGNKILVHRTADLQDTIWFTVLEKTNDSLQSWIEADEPIGFIKNK